MCPDFSTFRSLPTKFNTLWVYWRRAKKKLADAVQNLTAVVVEILNQATQQDDDVSSYEKRTRKVSQRGFGVGVAAIIFAVIAIILSTVAILLALQKRNELSRI